MDQGFGKGVERGRRIAPSLSFLNQFPPGNGSSPWICSLHAMPESLYPGLYRKHRNRSGDPWPQGRGFCSSAGFPPLFDGLPPGLPAGLCCLPDLRSQRACSIVLAFQEAGRLRVVLCRLWNAFCLNDRGREPIGSTYVISCRIPHGPVWVIHKSNPVDSTSARRSKAS